MSAAIKTQVGDWYPMLKPLIDSDYFKQIGKTIKKRKKAFVKVLPDTKITFRAFKLCPLNKVRIVILGEEPYSDGTATGLAFANEEMSSRIHPGLDNIIKAVEIDYGTLSIDFDITLRSWAKQGVLLLNAALTVERDTPGAHIDLWRPFTENFIESLSSSKDGIIFILWGPKAQYYEKFIKGDTRIFKGPHPNAVTDSGRNNEFSNSGHFMAANQILSQSINWCPSCDPEYFPEERQSAPF